MGESGKRQECEKRERKERKGKKWVLFSNKTIIRSSGEKNESVRERVWIEVKNFRVDCSLRIDGNGIGWQR